MVSCVAYALLALVPAAPSLSGRDVVSAMHDTRQFWVDKERLVFVRMLEPGRRDTTRTSDVRCNRYQAVGAAWLSAEVAFLVDGEQRWLEEYTEIATGAPLSDALFDPKQWPKAKR